ncbi:MAG: aspartyl-tRNA amidotransferase subunit B [Candidatus Binatia bacterium]|nr:MAG: aspartyl-tRNA amidotransferase subunit B [Candidatus Binatia bacterium]
MPSESEIQQALVRAIKARAREEADTLRGLLTAIKNRKVETGKAELAEEEVLRLVRAERKKRLEAIEFARDAGRTDLVERNERECAVLERYLPPELDPAALENAIRELSRELGTKAIGPLMAALRDRYPGRFDAKLASELIRKLE